MNKPSRTLFLLASCLAAHALVAGDFTLTYFGPNIGDSAHPRKVFSNTDLSKYELRAASSGSYYSSGYDVLNGAGRSIYLPIAQKHETVSGTNRLVVQTQMYYKYSTNPYQTVQMNIVLEQRGDDVYAWCVNMYQSSSSATSEHQPYSWMYFRDMGTEFGTVANGNRVVYGTIGYDWRDLTSSTDFRKGFGIDLLIIGLSAAEETPVTDLAGDIAVTGNCVIENPGKVTIAGKLTGDGDLTFRATEARCVTGDVVAGGEVTVGGETETFIPKATWIVAATDRRLSSLTNILADTVGTRAGVTTGGYGFWSNDGQTASVQVYAKVSSYWQVGSVLQLRQNGANVEATILGAYSYNDPWTKGYSSTTYQYGDIDLVAANQEDSSSTGCPAMSVATGYKTDGTFNGQAGLRNLRLYFADEILPSISVGTNVYMKSSWMTVATDRLLSTLTNVTAVMCGTRTLVAVPAAYGHWRNNGLFASVQVYRTVSENYQTGSILRFRQSGPNIQALILPYSYNKPWQNGFDKATYRYGDIDFEVCAATITDTSVFQSLTVATADSTGQSGLKDLKLYFDESQAQVAETTGLNQMTTGAVVRVCGTGSARMILDLNHAADAQGLPKDGTLDVGQNGLVVIRHQTQAKRVYIHDGGALYQATNNIFALSSPTCVSLDNGKLYLGGSPMDGATSDTKAFAYTAFHNVRFANGSDIIGHMPRVGYSADVYPYWYVCGTSPSYCSSGFRLFQGPSFVIDVEDVTNSSEPDFTIGGQIDRSVDTTTQDLATESIVKIGAGTVSVTADWSAQSSDEMDYGLIVSNGVWRFASDKSSNASLDILLKGGGLAVATNVSANVGTLAFETTSALALETGATIAIADWSDATSAAAQILFTGEGADAERAIRVGTSAGLTSEQIRKIRVNGRHVTQDANGYLVVPPRSLLITIR